MKSQEISQIIARELGVVKTTDLAELNKLLKAKAGQAVKFRITGKALGHFGYTVPIKALTADGIKIITVNKVILLRFSEIESFQKAKPKKERPVYATPKPTSEKFKKGAKKSKFDDEDDDDDEFDEDDLSDFDEVVVAPKVRRKPRAKPGGGSAFIPAKGKK